MKLAVYICTNAHYIPLTMLFLESFAERANISQPFDFYCYTDSEAMIETFSASPAYSWVTFRRGTVSKLQNFTCWNDDFFYGMGMKVYALQELHPHYDRVLYLDVDIMINRGLDELVNIDMQGKGLAAVPDFPFHRHGMIEVREPNLAEILSYRDELIGDFMMYVNSGVYLVDCTQPAKLMDYDEFAEQWRPQLVDQDWLNYVYRDNLLLLPDTFNFMTDQAFMHRLTFQQRIESAVAMGQAHIQHFHGSAKPWAAPTTYGYPALLAQASTTRFLEVYDRYAPLFEAVPEYAWLTEGVALNRQIMARADDLADRFAARGAK